MTLLKRKQVFVEAHLHDGTNAQADHIAEWIRSRGGSATALHQGTADISSEFAVVRLLDNVLTNLVVKGFWVVDLGENKIVAVPDGIIMDAYDIVKEEDYEPIRET